LICIDREKEHLKEEMLAKMEANQDRMMVEMDSQLQKMDACLGQTEATDLEANPEEIRSDAVHEEVPKENAVVKTIRAQKKQHGGGI
jgi:hypothetical protein